MDLRYARKTLTNAREIVIYSVENSKSTSGDLMMKLVYLGLRCRVYEDEYLQSIDAGNLTKGDVAIGISYSGCSKKTVDTMKLAKKSGATTLVITNFEGTPVSKYADILLCGSHEQYLYGDIIFFVRYSMPLLTCSIPVLF